MRYLHRPNHPQANENGMVEASLVDFEVRTSAPYVISDSMDAIKHHGTGRVIDSKAKFRADTKASGCVEIGNEQVRPRQPIKLDKRQRREDIKRTIYNLRSGIN